MNKIGLIARRPIQNILIRFSSQKFTYDYDAVVNANKCVVFMKGTPEAPNVIFFWFIRKFMGIFSVDSPGQ